MAQNIPENCTEYVIQKIVSPGVYWMAKSHDKTQCQAEMQELNDLLSKNVQAIPVAERLCTGKLIAVEDKNGFYRGRVTDVFKRNGKVTYCISLIDCGTVMESTLDHLYWIKSEELVKKKSVVTEVTIHGILPICLDLEYEKHLMGGLFQKSACLGWSIQVEASKGFEFFSRRQTTWSAYAHKYVQKLFEKNSSVFVRSVSTSDGNISGEIFFKREPQKDFVSLGQHLCDEGLAEFAAADTTSSFTMNTQGDKGIERKIPENALSTEVGVCNDELNNNQNRDQSFISTYSDDTAIDPEERTRQMNFCAPSDNQTKRKVCCTSSSILSSETYNSSSTIKNSFKRPSSIKSEETLNSSTSDSCKSMFTVIRRSLELYEKRTRKSKDFG